MIESLDSKLRCVEKTIGVTRPALCDKAGVNYKSLQQAISRGSKVASDTLDEICHAWNVPRGYFSKYTPILRVAPVEPVTPAGRAAARIEDVEAQKAHLEIMRNASTIGTEDFINWVRSGGGEAVKFEEMRGTVDLFYPMTPEDNIPIPYRIGPDSLASAYFMLEGEDHYTRKVGAFRPEVLEATKDGHMRASQKPYDVSDVQFHGVVDGIEVNEWYTRTIAKVPSKTGHLVTAVHAVRIEPPKWSTSELGDLAAPKR